MCALEPIFVSFNLPQHKKKKNVCSNNKKYIERLQNLVQITLSSSYRNGDKIQIGLHIYQSKESTASS